MKWGDIALQNAERNPDVTIAGEHRRAKQKGNTVHLADGNGKRGNKYNARPVTLDNVVFASGAEARTYAELQLRQASGEIADVQLQPKFELIPAFEDAHGEDVRAMTYTADFAFTDSATGQRVIVDVKGSNATQTRDFALRWKMLRYMHRHDSGVRFEIWER